MLTWKQSAALFLLCLIAFLPYLAKPEMAGFDTYHYLSALQVPESAFLLVKVALFCCLFASTYFVACLGKAFHQKGWLAGIFVFASPVWVMDFWKLETEQFAYPLLFLALYLFFTDRKWKALAALAPAIILWQGSALYLIAFGLTWHWLLLALIPMVYFGWKQMAQILPNLSVQENFPIVGVLYQFFLLFSASWIPRKLIPATLFFGTIAVMNAKYAIHLTPLLAIGMMLMFLKTKSTTLRSLAIAGPLIGLLLTTMIIVPYPPTGEQVAAAKLAIREARGETIYNDWSWGHLLEYYGGKPKARAGGKWDLNCSDCIRVTELELQRPCTCINCPAQLAVYKC